MNRMVVRMGAVRFVVALLTIGVLSACVQQPPPQRELPPLPSSPWGEKYLYRFEPPLNQSAASVPATIVVVNPFYKETESTLAEALYSKVAKGFSSSMGVDMDKLIISKGMTVKGPYLSLDEITYSDKKGSDLTLAPKVFLTAQTKYVGEVQYITYRNEAGQEEVRGAREFQMNIGGWIAFVMQEPLSGEKMWIKKLELEDTVVTGIESYEATPQYVTYQTGCFNEIQNSYVSGYTLGKLMYDGKIDAMADMLNKLYPTIMEKCWTYLDADEILSLKEKVQEIRVLKRY